MTCPIRLGDLLTNWSISEAALSTKRSGKMATLTSHSHQFCCWATTALFLIPLPLPWGVEERGASGAEPCPGAEEAMGLLRKPGWEPGGEGGGGRGSGANTDGTPSFSLKASCTAASNSQWRELNSCTTLAWSSIPVISWVAWVCIIQRM